MHPIVFQIAPLLKEYLDKQIPLLSTRPSPTGANLNPSEIPTKTPVQAEQLHDPTAQNDTKSNG